MKLSSVLAALMVLASSCCKVSSGFSFVVGGLLVSSDCSVGVSALVGVGYWDAFVIGCGSLSVAWQVARYCRSTYSKFAINKYQVSLYLWRL